LAFCRFPGEKMGCFWFPGVFSGRPGRAARLKKLARGIYPAFLRALLRAVLLVAGLGLGLVWVLGLGFCYLFGAGWCWLGWSCGSGFLAGFCAHFWCRFSVRFFGPSGRRFLGLGFGPVWAALRP
jgi:hypothetical protein